MGHGIHCKEFTRLERLCELIQKNHWDTGYYAAYGDIPLWSYHPVFTCAGGRDLTNLKRYCVVTANGPDCDYLFCDNPQEVVEEIIALITSDFGLGTVLDLDAENMDDVPIKVEVWFGDAAHTEDNWNWDGSDEK